MSIQKRFSIQELDRIKAAVREAESKISGEIVPVFVEKSGFYSLATYRAAILGAIAVFVLIIIFDRYVPSLAIYDPLLVFVFVSLGGFAGALKAHFINPVKRLMLSQYHLDQATKKRAENAFLEEEVFNTRQRTGIMIFVSFFEREVIVMADKGISKVVDQKVWDNLVRGIIDSVRNGKIVEGMEAAIKKCGDILLEKGFVIDPDDVNELKDDLRIE
ncbi:MAG: TPM domain-containing protein [Bacteroidota bacterium]